MRKPRFLAAGGLVAAVAVIVGTGLAVAGPPGLDAVLAKLGLMDGKLDTIASTQTAHGVKLDALATSLSNFEEREDDIRVEVSVWEEACIGVGVQCTSFHSTDPASSLNHNPVAIRFFVTRNGTPVAGLTSDDVLLHVNSFPATGPGIERCDNGDGECSAYGGDFQDAGLGLYVLWVHPFFEPPSEFPWKAGSYAFVLRVTDADGTQGYGFGEIEIAE